MCILLLYHNKDRAQKYKFQNNPEERRTKQGVKGIKNVTYLKGFFVLLCLGINELYEHRFSILCWSNLEKNPQSIGCIDYSTKS